MIPLAVATILAMAVGDDAPDLRPAVALRLVHPDRQLAALLALFEGSRAPHPAAALAAWKRAHRGATGLGKPLEAALAALNPEMVRELRVLDEAEISLRFDPADGRLRWRATVPQDDGTAAALATALALTGGGDDPPLDGLQVDRLGPPGAPLMVRDGAAVAAAGTRPDLRAALDRLRAPPYPAPSIASGFLVRLDPSAPDPSGPLLRRHLAEALRALGGLSVEGSAALEGEAIRIVLTGRFADPPPGGAAIEPSWVDLVPADRTLAVVALSLDPSPAAWDTAFALANRVERADPARAGLAPLRTRLNLAALAAKVNPEADLWPRLRGVSLCLESEAGRPLAGAVIALHADAPSSAERIARRLLPALATALRLGPSAEPGDRISLGRLANRPLTAVLRGSTVLIGWGDLIPACLDALDHPDRSAGPALRASWDAPPPRRFGAVWPGRLPRLPPASPLASALADSPPILWGGRGDGTTTRDEIRWEGLRGTIRRFLERVVLGSSLDGAGPPSRLSPPTPEDEGTRGHRARSGPLTPPAGKGPG